MAIVLEERAVRGVGALMRDFLGVSVTCLRMLKLDEEDAGFVVVAVGRGLRPAVINGCRIAA